MSSSDSENTSTGVASQATSSAQTGETNPLLEASPLPLFDRIQSAHIRPAIDALLAETEAGLEALEASGEASWDGLITPLERLGDRLQRAWGIAGHLLGVRNEPDLRSAYEEAQPNVVRCWMRIAQSPTLYARLCELREGEAYAELDPAQRRIVESLLRDARLSGVGLEGEAREQFNQNTLELAELGTRFSNHVLDSTKAFALVLTDPEQVRGLPASLLERCAAAQRESAPDADPQATPEHGPWRITLDRPCFQPFMQYSPHRELREQVFRAYVTRASLGDLDNAPLIDRILELRREQAVLLGFSTYAELSLASKMAPDVERVEELLRELRDASWEPAKAELETLREAARAAGAPEAEDFAPWDSAFWAERVREQRFAYSEEELRPYFPLPRVLEGLFNLTQRLFGVSIVEADGEAPVWHPDVRFFHVRDAGGDRLASFYLDPYSRPAEKRGGAWMDECLGRSRSLDPQGKLQLPVAYLICNGSPPVGERPSLMTFSEVETLFHEFGHGLQHMLTRVDYGLASGIRNIEWDAVELPSQFMENWCYHEATLLGLSAHVETGEPLPKDLFDKVRAARTYRAASAMLRQLAFARLDLELHHRYDAGAETPFQLQARIARDTEVLQPLAEDRFLCSFEHIFAGGYSAGYYSYKWAEVLSADAFSAFEEAGLEQTDAVRETGRRFRETVLALGGSVAPGEVFERFRGRAPITEPLLRHSGLLPAAA